MSVQPIDSAHHAPIARTQNAVATAAAVKAGTASGRGATAVLRELHHSGTSQAPGRTL